METKVQGKGIRNFLRRQRAKLASVLSLSMVMVATFCSSAFASTTTDFSAITTAVTSKLTVAEVAAVIAAIIAAGMAFVLLWWGARKLVNAIINAFKTGKIRF